MIRMADTSRVLAVTLTVFVAALGCASMSTGGAGAGCSTGALVEVGLGSKVGEGLGV